MSFRYAASLALVVVASCASVLRYDYVFGASQHRDYFVHEGLRDPAHLEPDQRAILLLPKGVTVLAGGGGALPRAQINWPDLYEAYQGPARVFFVPGRKQYRVSVSGDIERGWKGAAFPLNLDLSRGHAYEIRARETNESVEWELVDVGPERYARLHRGGRLQAQLVHVKPLTPPALPLGLQDDGSIVLPPDERFGIGAVQFSAPLFPCPTADSRLMTREQRAATTLAAAHLLAVCPEIDRRSPAKLGEGLLRCAYERFGSKGVWPESMVLDASLCSRVLGSGWTFPPISLLRNLGASQASILRRLASDAPGRPFTPDRIFAVADTGIVVVTLEGYLARDTDPVRLRCVRVPTSATPAVHGGGRCEARKD